MAYEGGEQIAAQRVVVLQKEILGLKRNVATLDGELRTLAAAHERLKIANNDLKKRYAAEVPRGARKELLALVDKRLSAGVRKDRLAFAVAGIRNRAECDGTPVTKRFIVRTLFSNGAASSVSFFDNRVTVTGRGEPSADAEGKPEAWFDAEQKVTLKFAWLGGRGSEKTGVLPIHHAIAEGNAEHRFTVVKGDRRGFANVTWIRCDFPG